MNHPTLKRLPFLLAGGRMSLGFGLPAFVCLKLPVPVLAFLFLLGFCSDIADGVIARRLGIATLELRRWDSRADLVFLVGSVIAACLLNPMLRSEGMVWIYAYACLFLLRNIVDYLRYRTSPSYHMWSGKIWAFLISAYLFMALLGSSLEILLPLAFAVYAINTIEGIAASLILPRPLSDIPSLWHVLKLKEKSPSLPAD